MNWFCSVLVLAVVSTGAAIWAVGFSKRWKSGAKDFLKKEFGEGPTDEEVAEESRRYAAMLWLSIAAVAWFVVAAIYRHS